MKFIYTLFLIPFIFIIMGPFVATSCFGSISDSNLTYYTSIERYSNLSNQTELEGSYSNNASSSIISTDKNKGLLIVKVTTMNGKLGMNTSSDFIINVHANNPTPALFNGNSETLVKLSMGMYTVTISSLPNYNSSFSGDCTGGIMKVETKICNIVNTYSNP